LPLDAFTEDASFIESYTTAFREITEHFKPDVILTQNGADAHFLDPLTHLSVTMDTYSIIPKLAHDLAHEYCGGTWIAVGGGGYDIWRLVTRAWSLIWLEMIGKNYQTGALASNWVNRCKGLANIPLCEHWEDPVDLYTQIPRRQEIEAKN